MKHPHVIPVKTGISLNQRDSRFCGNDIVWLLLVTAFLIFIFPFSHAHASSSTDLILKAKQLASQAELAHKDRERRKLAEEGMTATRECLLTDPQNVECLYWQAVNRGWVLSTKIFGVRAEILVMKKEFETVRAKRPDYDSGGADRALGQLALQLPSLPVLGSDLRRDLVAAKKHAQAALGFAPKSSDNIKLWRDVSAAMDVSLPR